MKHKPQLLLQDELAECGLACVAMLAGAFGKKLTLAEMRTQFQASARGASLRQLIGICGRLDLAARAVKVDIDSIREIDCPAILHWDLNHFVVLAAWRGRRAEVLDPGRGRLSLTVDEISRHFTGVALEVRPTDKFEKKEAAPRAPWSTLIGPLHRVGGYATNVVAFSLLVQIGIMALPFQLQWLIDDVLPSSSTDLIWVSVLVAAMIVALTAASMAMRDYCGAVLSASVRFQWTSNLLAKTLRLPIHSLERRPAGDIVGRFQTVDEAQSVLSGGLIAAGIDAVLAVVCLGLIWAVSWPVGVVASATVVVITAVRVSTYPQEVAARREAAMRWTQQFSRLAETLAEIRAVRLFQRSQERQVLWASAFAEQINAELRAAKLQAGVEGAKLGLAGAGRAIAIGVGVYLVTTGQFTLGQLMTSLFLAEALVHRVDGLLHYGSALARLRVCAERISPLVLEDDEPTQLIEQGEERSAPTVELRDVCFRYSPTDDLIIDRLSFLVPSGGSVALVGQSGCGKSTAAKLILGLLRPKAGQILIDGRPLAQFGVDSLRNIAASVLQDDLLFDGSILENVSFFDPSPDHDWARECCSLAGILADVERMPMRLATHVGVRGSFLSGGQRQRILLARALYKRPKLLLLDEATSHLDVDCEAKIVDRLRRMNITRIIIAHREASIRAADAVVRVQRTAPLRSGEGLKAVAEVR